MEMKLPEIIIYISAHILIYVSQMKILNVDTIKYLMNGFKRHSQMKTIIFHILERKLNENSAFYTK